MPATGKYDKMESRNHFFACSVENRADYHENSELTGINRVNRVMMNLEVLLA